MAGVAALAPIAAQAAGGLIDRLSFLDNLLGTDATEAANSAEQPPESKVPIDELSDELLQQFAARGVDLGTPVRLRLDLHGHVRVVEDHPDRVLIESLFDQSDELTSKFRAVATKLSQQLPDSGIAANDVTLVATPDGLSLDVG